MWMIIGALLILIFGILAFMLGVAVSCMINMSSEKQKRIEELEFENFWFCGPLEERKEKLKELMK